MSPMIYRTRYRVGAAASVLVAALSWGGFSTAAQEQSMALPPPTPPQPAAQSQDQQPQSNSDLPMTDHARSSGETTGGALPMQPPTPPQPGQNQEVDRIDRGVPQEAQLGVFMVSAGGPAVRIQSVTSGSAAEAAGLLPGDVILDINGQAPGTPQAVSDMIRRMRPGDVIQVRILRNGVEHMLNVTLHERQQVVAQGQYVESPGYVSAGPTYYYEAPVRQRVYRYYPGPSYGYYPRGYYYGGGYGWYGDPFYRSGRYYGTPNLGYFRGRWGGEGVNVGGLQFRWR